MRVSPLVPNVMFPFITLLPVAAEAEQLATALLATRALPSRAQTDAAHLAIAAVGKADYQWAKAEALRLIG